MPYKDKEMQRAAQKKHFEANKEKFVARTSQRRLERSTWWVEYKNEKRFECVKCGENHPACICFHHRNSEEKTMGVSDLVVWAYPVETILEEIEKCDVLCHNCHAKHHCEFDNRRAKHVGGGVIDLKSGM